MGAVRGVSGPAKKAVEDALLFESMWTESLSDALAASPATIEAVGKLVEGP